MDDQASCGQRPIPDRLCSLKRSPVALGEIPFHVRISDETGKHVSNGVMISSCWVLTTGQQISPHDVKNLRAKFGSRRFTETEKSELEYAQVHQISKRIKVGDLYLLQLYPSSELSSECVPLSDTVQPICLEQDPLQVGSNRASNPFLPGIIILIPYERDF